MFKPIWPDDTNWAIFFRGAETSNHAECVAFGSADWHLTKHGIPSNGPFFLRGTNRWSLLEMGCSENCGPPCHDVIMSCRWSTWSTLFRRRIRPWQKASWPRILCVPKIGEAHGKSAVQVRSGKLFSEQIWTRPVVSTRYALCLVWCKTTSDPSFNYCVMLNSLVGGSEHFWFFHILGMSSSQLTNSIIFQRGRAQPPASFDCSFLGLGPMFFGDTRATGCLPIGWWPADLIDQRSFVYENRNRMGTSPLNRALESFARRK